MKSGFATFLLILVALAGVCLLAYPTVSDWWNSSRQSRVVLSYGNAVADIDKSELEAIRASAREYNELLADLGNKWVLSDEQMTEYESQLVVPGSSVMGYVEIPKIDCMLPIYHGVSEDVLQVAVGHLEGSSLPVGGEGTHSVLSGHSGLTSARLFTDLDQMVNGDRFVLHVLGEELTYEVDQVLTVLPEELDALEVVEGEDYCTLFTCTPYGVNSHRLLVRGARVDSAFTDAALVPSDATAVNPLLVGLCVAIPVALVGGACVALGSRKS